MLIIPKGSDILCHLGTILQAMPKGVSYNQPAKWLGTQSTGTTANPHKNRRQVS